jgi:uncharacterized repeat protein (TIGR04138 family)
MNKDESKSDPKDIEQIILDDGRYQPEAFGFLHEGLARAVGAVHGESKETASHVTGQQLCKSLRELALQRWGLMAPVVLRRWGIGGSIDFGNMVYLLISHGLMKKTEQDSVEDFRDIFDLDRDFDNSSEIRLKE